ncbi:HNH endonuclease signature motif containing protein [uncultured Nostoc sp.]|uniref:HNH endonuclease signature motif containing protein n=1 Tax=uncultured Nostoc sp. TaxID=340711 RepID=UPI0035CC1514
MSNILPIPGFESSHSIGDDGTVYRNIGGVLKPLKGSISYHGYRKVHLRHSVIGKIEAVHRLVAAMFIGECKNSDFVTHINGDRLDNRVDNLKYVPRKESNKSTLRRGENNHFAKLTEKTVRAIKGQIGEGKRSDKQIAVVYGVSERTIRNIASGKTWKHLA